MYLNAVLWALHLHSFVCADITTETQAALIGPVKNWGKPQHMYADAP